VTDVVGYLQRMASSALGRALTAPEVTAFTKYLNILTKWQKSQRLIGSTEPTWIVDNVIVDSLLFRRAIPTAISTLCDVGSGAGLPGIPLSIVMPDVDVTLIEARQKRGSFLAAAIRELGLRNCRLLNQRLEEAAQALPGRFDAVVMRCAGNPTLLIAQLRAVLVPGGLVVAAGPPKREPLELGRWLEIEGPHGLRRFWIYNAA
jgi:16S rRNA (guanine527-N7)-methyltransferase